MSATQDGKIGLGTAIIIGLNAMIGVGIIAVPSLLATETGPAGILTFVFSVCAVLLIALSLGEVAHRFPGEGWNYLYPAQWGGHALGMLSSTLYFLGVTVAMGFLAQMAGLYASFFLPTVNPTLLGVGILFVLTALVFAGAEISSWGQYVIICSVLGPLFLTSLLCWSHFNPAYTAPFMPYGVRSIFAAAPKALFGLLGFESVISLYAIVENPQKNVPRAAALAITIIGLFYIFFASGIIFAINPALFVEGGFKPLSEILALAFPHLHYLQTFVTIGVLFGIVGTLHSMIWSLSVLFMSILQRAKGTRMRFLVNAGIMNLQVSTIIVGSIILLFALTVRGGTLVDLTAMFMIPSYVFSIMPLLFVKESWTSGSNIRTLGALATALVMFYYATMPVFGLFAG